MTGGRAIELSNDDLLAIIERAESAVTEEGRQAMLAAEFGALVDRHESQKVAVRVPPDEVDNRRHPPDMERKDALTVTQQIHRVHS